MPIGHLGWIMAGVLGNRLIVIGSSQIQGLDEAGKGSGHALTSLPAAHFNISGGVLSFSQGVFPCFI
jgi:hypothetical protein